MENKNLKLAVILTVVGIAIYSTLLLMLSSTDKLVENQVMVLTSINGTHPYWKIPLSFELSYWWNLIFFPLPLILFMYITQEEYIIGKEPHTDNLNLQDKFSVKLAIFSVKIVARIIAIACTFFQFFSNLFFEKQLAGPLSALVLMVMVFVVIYVFLGTFLPLLGGVTANQFYGKRKTKEIYTSLLIQFTKIGSVKTFPFILGLTVGFLIKYPIENLYIFIKSIKITRKSVTN